MILTTLDQRTAQVLGDYRLMMERADLVVTAHPEDAATLRAYRAGTLVGYVTVRNGRIVHAEHCGRAWFFWPDETDTVYNRKVAEWKARVREYAP